MLQSKTKTWKLLQKQHDAQYCVSPSTTKSDWYTWAIIDLTHIVCAQMWPLQIRKLNHIHINDANRKPNENNNNKIMKKKTVAIGICSGYLLCVITRIIISCEMVAQTPMTEQTVEIMHNIGYIRWTCSNRNLKPDTISWAWIVQLLLCIYIVTNFYLIIIIWTNK